MFLECAVELGGDVSELQALEDDLGFTPLQYANGYHQVGGRQITVDFV